MLSSRPANQLVASTLPRPDAATTLGYKPHYAHIDRQLTDRENFASSRRLEKRPSAIKYAEMNQGRESAESDSFQPHAFFEIHHLGQPGILPPHAGTHEKTTYKLCSDPRLPRVLRRDE